MIRGLACVESVSLCICSAFLWWPFFRLRLGFDCIAQRETFHHLSQTKAYTRKECGLTPNRGFTMTV